jgi:hypothetical protein
LDSPINQFSMYKKEGSTIYSSPSEEAPQSMGMVRVLLGKKQCELAPRIFPVRIEFSYQAQMLAIQGSATARFHFTQGRFNP